MSVFTQTSAHNNNLNVNNRFIYSNVLNKFYTLLRYAHQRKYVINSVMKFTSIFAAVSLQWVIIYTRTAIVIDLSQSWTRLISSRDTRSSRMLPGDSITAGTDCCCSLYVLLYNQNVWRNYYLTVYAEVLSLVLETFQYQPQNGEKYQTI